jgi:hypothetical protein
MKNPVKERIMKLREKKWRISEAHQLYLQRRKEEVTRRSGDHARRLQILPATLDELVALTALKKL